MSLKRLLSWTVFPLLTGGIMTAAIVAIDDGVSPALALALGTLLAVLVISALERLQPHNRRWNLARGDVATDLLHMFVSTLTVPQLLNLTLLGLASWGGAHLALLVGLALWPADWPLVAQLAWALVIAEFGQYWVHRLSHETPWLWRVHATHHSAERLYWLNSGRFHPLDTALQYSAEIVPLALLGVTPEALALFTLFTAVHGLFQHANVDLRLGPLNWIFSMAELHRWHHAASAKEGNSNYGANLILWDVVFNTRYLPSPPSTQPAIGIADMPDFPSTYWAQLATPFRWPGPDKTVFRAAGSPSPLPATASANRASRMSTAAGAASAKRASAAKGSSAS